MRGSCGCLLALRESCGVVSNNRLLLQLLVWDKGCIRIESHGPLQESGNKQIRMGPFISRHSMLLRFSCTLYRLSTSCRVAYMPLALRCCCKCCTKLPYSIQFMSLLRYGDGESWFAMCHAGRVLFRGRYTFTWLQRCPRCINASSSRSHSAIASGLLLVVKTATA